MKGQMLAVNRDKQEILVKHEEITGYMMAMTMPYKVQSAGMLDNVGRRRPHHGPSGGQRQRRHDHRPSRRPAPRHPTCRKPSPLSDGIVMLLKDGQKVAESAADRIRTASRGT